MTETTGLSSDLREKNKHLGYFLSSEEKVFESLCPFLFLMTLKTGIFSWERPQTYRMDKEPSNLGSPQSIGLLNPWSGSIFHFLILLLLGYPNRVPRVLCRKHQSLQTEIKTNIRGKKSIRNSKAWN